MLTSKPIANVAPDNQTASTVTIPDVAPPLAAMSPVMHKAGDNNNNNNSSLPDWKAVCRCLVDVVDPAGNLDVTHGLRDYMLALPFPDESGAWDKVATEHWLERSTMSFC